MRRDPEREARNTRWRAWMHAAQRGESEPYELLLRELLPYLRSRVGARVHEPSSVEDVVQNLLFAIHRARHTYRAERPFLPWLHAVTRNAIVDHQRQHSRRRRREVPMEDLEDRLEAPTPSPVETPLSEGMVHALAQLPPSQREAVELVHVHSLSVAEAASRAGVTPGALKVRAHRGYRRLREALSEGRG